MTPKVKNLLSIYLADPNCWPELWISEEDVTQEEKHEFINAAIDELVSLKEEKDATSINHE